jgi:hypothetical protein
LFGDVVSGDLLGAAVVRARRASGRRDEHDHVSRQRLVQRQRALQRQQLLDGLHRSVGVRDGRVLQRRELSANAECAAVPVARHHASRAGAGYLKHPE